MRRLISKWCWCSAIVASLSAATIVAQNSERDVITRARIEADVRYLASDELHGRRTGEPEAVIAAKWIAEQLKADGLAPAGDSGSYLQRVPMVKTHRVSKPRLRAKTAHGEELEFTADIDFDQPDLSRDAKLAHVVLVKTAADLPPKPALDVALVLPESREERQKLLEAAKTPKGDGWGLLITLGPTSAGHARDDANYPDGLRVVVGELSSIGQRLRVRGDARSKFEKGEIASLELTAGTQFLPVEAFNVIGEIAGERDECVVVSAHYDHLGVAPKASKPADDGKPVDLIFNGADDDASGCSVALELARALGHAKKPVRTLIFFFAVGEEVGLLGTDWYLDHPTAPIEKTVLNLNFEMLGHPDPLVGGAGKLWLTGDERSNLGAAFREQKLPIEPDRRPEQNFFERSDNIGFVRRGVVGQTLSSFNLKTPYHEVTDEAQTLDYAHMEACARASYDALELIASGTLTPKWLPAFEAKH